MDRRRQVSDKRVTMIRADEPPALSYRVLLENEKYFEPKKSLIGFRAGHKGQWKNKGGKMSLELIELEQLWKGYVNSEWRDKREGKGLHREIPHTKQYGPLDQMLLDHLVQEHEPRSDLRTDTISKIAGFQT